jgi:hypothetical protein
MKRLMGNYNEYHFHEGNFHEGNFHEGNFLEGNSNDFMFTSLKTFYDFSKKLEINNFSKN